MASDDENNLREAVEKFLEAFEAVFHDDWPYTMAQLGIRRDDRGAVQLAEILGEAPLPPPDPERTFLDLRTSDLEGENWGNYELLLQAYTRLREVVPRRR